MIKLGFVVTLGVIASVANADIYNYAEWTSATVGLNGSAAGTLVMPDASTINVSYAGEVENSTQINNTGIQYFTPVGTYINGTVDNAPSRTDLITLRGQASNPITNTLSFSSPVTNPIFTIVSLGAASAAEYNFDTAFTILGDGQGFWGGATGNLTNPSGNILRGVEGSGVIQFTGTFSSISWTSQPDEYWHGFNVGVSAVPEPASMAALGLGALGMLRRRKQK